MPANTRLVDAARAKIELLRKQAWNDLYIFAKFVCGCNLMEEQPHREVCEFLTYGVDKSTQLDLNCTPAATVESVKNSKGVLKKLVMLHRGSFKSTIATLALPLWLLWHNPSLRIMIDSEVLGNSKKFLAAIKDMIDNNPMLKLVCTDENGDYILEPNYKMAGGFTEEQVILLHRTKIGLREPSVFCAGVDLARTGMHPDVIIMDDIVSERNVTTDDQLGKVSEHYKLSLSLLEPGGLQIIIGTRYHMADLYGELLQSEEFDIMVRPAIDDKGVIYFPSRFSKEHLESLRKAQGSYIFSCQYMLNPIDDSNAIFKKANIQYYAILPTFVAKYIMVDLAISQADTADYFVCMCAGLTEDKKVYVIDYDRNRYLPKQQIASIFSMYDKHKDKCKGVGIETVAYQKALLYLIKDEMRRTGHYMPLRELKADKDKIRRIQALQPLFENGDVYIKQHHIELEQELLEFPVSKHDDVIDALAYLLQMLKPGGVVPKKREYTYTPSNRFVNY